MGLTPEREAQVRAMVDDEFAGACELGDALMDVLAELDRLREIHPQD